MTITLGKERERERKVILRMQGWHQVHIYICDWVLLILLVLTDLFREPAKKADTLQWRKKGVQQDEQQSSICA